MFRQSTLDKCPPNGWVKQKKNCCDNIPITGMLQKSQNKKNISAIYKILLFIPTYSTHSPQIWNSCNDTGALDKVPKSMGHLLTTFV